MMECEKITISLPKKGFWTILSDFWQCVTTACIMARTTDTQWRHKSKITENLGRCGIQNMLRPYLKFGSGSGFSAVQWRQFPVRVSVVRVSVNQEGAFLNGRISFTKEHLNYIFLEILHKFTLCRRLEAIWITYVEKKNLRSSMPTQMFSIAAPR